MKKGEWSRVYGSQIRVRWISDQPSIVSGRGPCENVHVRNGGKGRKADACWIVPLTFEEHWELHQHGQKTFEKKYGIDLMEEAEKTERKWQEEIEFAKLVPY